MKDIERIKVHKESILLEKPPLQMKDGVIYIGDKKISGAVEVRNEMAFLCALHSEKVSV